MKRIILTILILFMSLPCLALEGQKRVAYGFMYHKDVNKNAIIYNIFEGSPADGVLFPGDQIIMINGTKIKPLNRTDTQQLLSGDEGTIIKLKIQRNNKLLDINVEKKKVFISDYIELAPKLYFNWTNVQILPNYPNYVFVWIKILNNPNFKKTVFYKENALYARKFWGFNCQSGYMTQLEHIEYYKDNTYFAAPSVSNFQNMNWEKVVPNTVSEAVFNIACYYLYLENNGRRENEK